MSRRRKVWILLSDTNISKTEARTTDTDERRTLMNASTVKAVGGEIVWPVRMRAKIVKKVAVGLAINEKHSMIDNKTLFLRIIQTSLL